MKVYYKKSHVKTIPQKFSVLKGLGKRFKDSRSKYLSTKERLDLEIELYRHDLDKFVKELIQGLDYNGCEEVHTNRGDKYYIAKFGNYKLRIPERIYILSGSNKESYTTV